MTSADTGCPATLQAVTAVTTRQSLGRPTQRDGLAQPEPDDRDHHHVRGEPVAHHQPDQLHVVTQPSRFERSDNDASPHTRPWLNRPYGHVWVPSCDPANPLLPMPNLRSRGGE